MKSQRKKIEKYLFEKSIKISKGTKLYHGTMYTLPNNYPSNKANWFATDPEQSALHVMKKMSIPYDIYGESTDYVDNMFEKTTINTVTNIYPKLYVYETLKDMYLFNLGDTGDMKEFANMIGYKTFEEKDDFSEHNKSIASYLCDLIETNKQIIGWYRMKDQREVVICYDTKEFLNHINTVNMRDDVLPFDWKIVQKYIQEYKKYELIRDKNTLEIQILQNKCKLEFDKFIGKTIDDLFEDSSEVDYDDKELTVLWKILSDHFEPKFTIRHKKQSIELDQLMVLFEDYFGNEIFEYLNADYQESLEKLANIISKINKLKNQIQKAEGKYTSQMEGSDDIVNKAIEYINKNIKPIVSKIYFCLLVKEGNNYNCKTISSMQPTDVILCSYWTSNDVKLLRDIAKAFGYKYNKIKNQACFN